MIKILAKDTGQQLGRSILFIAAFNGADHLVREIIESKEKPEAPLTQPVKNLQVEGQSGGDPSTVISAYKNPVEVKREDEVVSAYKSVGGAKKEEEVVSAY